MECFTLAPERGTVERVRRYGSIDSRYVYKTQRLTTPDTTRQRHDTETRRTVEENMTCFDGPCEGGMRISTLLKNYTKYSYTINENE